MILRHGAYTVRDLIEHYKVGKTKLYEEVAEGRLVARKFGTRTLFLAEDVEAWIKSWPVSNTIAADD